MLMFLFFGLILFFNTLYIVAKSVAEYVFIGQTSREIAIRYQLSQRTVEEILMNYFEPIKYKAMLYSFFLSFCLLFMARYAQKVINRNKYILLLEKEWLKRKARV
jgi:hypothetical protein